MQLEAPAYEPNPLDDDEIETLLEMIYSPALADDSLTLEGMDGFLCALAVNPVPIEPEVWLPHMLGSTAPDFESEDEADLFYDLIHRHWQSIVHAVRKDPEEEPLASFAPLMEGDPDMVDDDDLESDLGDNWADGFLSAMVLSGNEWIEAMQDEDFMDLLSPIMMLDKESENPEPDDIIDHGRRRELVGMLPLLAHVLWDYWHGELPEADEEATLSALRPHDAPCACGSGKAYKKCCLN